MNWFFSYLTPEDYASIFYDLAAVLLLTGTILFTSIYRLRRRPSDRLYFVLLITDLLMAMADIRSCLLSDMPGTDPTPLRYNMISNTIFHLCFSLIPVMICFRLQLQQREQGPEIGDQAKPPFGVTVLKQLILLLPAAVSVAMVLINCGTGFLYYIDPVSSAYVSTGLYPLIFLPAAFYGCVILFLLLKNDFRMFFMFFTLIFVRVFMGVFERSVSSTALFFAIWLVYTHITEMNRAFSGEAA